MDLADRARNLRSASGSGSEAEAPPGRPIPAVRPTLLIVSGTPPPYSGPEVVTAFLLTSPLRETCRLVHLNISKRRHVATKGRFDVTNLLFGLWQPLKMAFFALRYRPQLVYTNMAQNTAGFLRYASFVAVAKLARRPVVVRVMGDRFLEFYRRASPALRFVIRCTLRSIDGFIVRAEALKRQFDGLVPPDKLHVVHQGIDVAPFSRQRARAVDGAVRVLFVGYLTRAKGAFDLLAAVPKVVARSPGVEFQLMGRLIDVERNVVALADRIGNRSMLHSLLADPVIAGHVELLGEQIGEAKARAFEWADIFVLPSYSEAFPTVVLEAMAAGLPVVATRVGALPEVFGDDQILYCDSGDVEALAEQIVRLASDPSLRDSMGRLNHQCVAERFDQRAYAKRLYGLVRHILAAH